MSIIRRIQRLYEPNTNPGYTRIGVKVDQLTILDPDVTEKELASADTYVEPKRDGSLLEGYDYFKIGDVHIDHFDKAKDRIPETEEPSLLQTDEPERMETGTLDMRDDGEVNYVPSDVVDYLGESIQWLSKPNLELNLDRFKSGKDNVLLITGISAGGKSTLAHQLASEYNAEIISLDIISLGLAKGKNRVEKAASDPSLMRAFKSEVHPLDLEYMRTHSDLPWGKVPKDAAFDDVDYLNWLIKRCPKIKGRRFVIEGTQILHNDPSVYKNLPIIVVGTGAVVAYLRRVKRVSSEKNWVRTLKTAKNFPWLLNNSKDVNDFRKNVLQSYQPANDPGVSLKEDVRMYPSSIPEYYNESVKSSEVSHSSSLEEINGAPVENKETLSIRKNRKKPVTMTVDHLQEAAMKAKQRNALDVDQFGLPRTRSYPLNDAKHVKAAIRMFHYCKDPEDQKTLAHNIFKAMRSKGVDMKIGEGNPLYKYAPEDLREAAYPKFSAYMVDKPMDKRTKEDIVKEHLRVNADYYNNAFYGTEYASMIEELNGMDFLDVFYPNLRSMSFANRQLTVIGGLMAKDAHGYRADKNWFKVDLSKDQNHIEYCKKLYPILGKMLLDPVWDPRTLTPYEMGVILDWYQRVSYHYGRYKDADSEADKLKETQYLWDLYWNYNENPDDPHIKAVNVIALVSQMRAIDAKGKAIHINEDQILGRQQLREYLAKELGDNAEIYLLPDTKEYPIIDQASVQLAMDKINTVPKDKRRIFAKNLNRRYRELGCNFSISADHPYARYADQKILDRMTNVLMEDNSLPIDDQSHALEDKAAREGRPYYRRSDVEPGSNWHNILDNKEMGPNNLKQQRPDYQGGEALL